jgi:Domain of unknown function (DUF1877)
LATTAVTGTSQVTPGALSVQGFRIMWTLPDDCEMIHLWLDELTILDLKSKYDPPQMQRAQLYKWSQTNEAEEDSRFGLITNDFFRLKRFYADVVTQHEAILVVCD